MIPGHTLSGQYVPRKFIPPDNIEPGTELIDYERGGIALRDPSQGYNVQDWMGYYYSQRVFIKPENGPAVALFERIGVESLSIAFDQNMNPAVAFTQGGDTWLYWYDSSQQGQVFTNYGDTVLSPKLSLDDKRVSQTNSSDIIFSYIENNNLYFRAQRDRFLIPYLLAEDVNATLLKIGMNVGYRFQLKLKPNEL